MEIKASEIAKNLGCPLEGKDLPIKGAASPGNARESDLIYAEPGRLSLLKYTGASCAIIHEDAPRGEIPERMSLILSKNPRLSFAQFLRIVERENRRSRPGASEKAFVSPSARVASSAEIREFAVISENAAIGENARVGANCFVGENSAIGDGSVLHPNAVVRENCVIGKNAVIHSSAVIGSDGFGYVRDGNAYFKIPQLGRVIISDGAEIGAGCAVDKATLGETVIGEGTKLDNLVHVAHNVKIGKNCLVLALSAIAGSSVVEDNVIIGGQVGISDHVTIGVNSIIMSKTGVMTDIKPGSVMFGHFAKPRREVLKQEVLISKLPEIHALLKKVKKKLNL